MFKTGDEIEHAKAGYSNSQVKRMVSKIRDSMADDASDKHMSGNNSINLDKNVSSRSVLL